MRQTATLCGNGLTPVQITPSFSTIVRKGEIACYKQFFFSHNVFHSYISVMRQTATLCGNGLLQAILLFSQCFP